MTLSDADRAEIARVVGRGMRARGLRIAMRLAWWEVLLETGNRRWWRPWFAGIGGRWEYLGADDRWHRYWRRGGSVPDEALDA
jgi:hypothetical protein